MSPEADNPAVLVEIESGVATITFNRPGRNNGWAGDLENAYYDALDAANRNPDVRAIVVTGAGKSFCPGADMNLLQGFGASGGRPASGGSLTGPEKRPGTFALSITKPLIGAINGACAGVGLVQAMMFDVRFAAPHAKFTFAFSQRGLIAEYGAAWMLPRLVGQSNALDLLMSSRVVLAEEAKSLGLINGVVPADELLDHAKSYAHELATKCNPTSMAIIKRQIYGDYGKSLTEALAEADTLMGWTLTQPNFREGVSSFVEKRPPSFTPHTGTTGDPLEG